MCSVFTATHTQMIGFLTLLTSMTVVLPEDVGASFLFEGDLNCHHQEWLGSTTTNRHSGAAAFGFATVSGFDQLVVGPTHARGGTLDLQMTDVPDLGRVPVVAARGDSDHSSISVGSHFDGSGCLKLVCREESFP